MMGKASPSVNPVPPGSGWPTLDTGSDDGDKPDRHRQTPQDAGSLP